MALWVIGTPCFMLHVFEAGSSIPLNTPIVEKVIGDSYQWKSVGPDNMDIKLLTFPFRESATILTRTSEEELQFAKQAMMWFAKPIDMRKAYPY
jgi:hypothetical protein